MSEFSQKVQAYLVGPEGEQRKRRLAHQFSCSLPTIQRWADGENEPHPMFQPKVLNFIEEDSA